MSDYEETNTRYLELESLHDAEQHLDCEKWERKIVTLPDLQCWGNDAKGKLKDIDEGIACCAHLAATILAMVSWLLPCQGSIRWHWEPVLSRMYTIEDWSPKFPPWPIKYTTMTSPRLLIVWTANCAFEGAGMEAVKKLHLVAMFQWHSPYLVHELQHVRTWTTCGPLSVGSIRMLLTRCST